MMGFKGLALHTWTLDTTPLPELLRIARETGWEAVELRQLDFARAAEAGQSTDEVIRMVRETGLAVSAMGARLGWMWAEGDERRELFGVMEDACRWASALGCDTVQCPVDFGTGDLARAAASVREVGDLAARYGVRVAIEPYTIAQQLNSLARGRKLLEVADDPRVGFDVDSYHVERGGDGVEAVRELPPEQIVYVQYSDVPADAGPARESADLLNRLPPSQGVVPFREFFAALADRGYAGYLSYEAPNPAAWARDPVEVAREARKATLAVL
jgi:2-keto-myo-inositol isomerase